MAKWIGASILAVSLMFDGAISPVPAAPLRATLQKSFQKPPAEDFSARRRIRQNHHFSYRLNDRPYPTYPTYYDRPYYYTPAPFFPLFGLGYGPWW